MAETETGASEKKQPAKFEVGLGMVQLLSKDGKAGVIEQLDGSGEAYFDVTDLTSEFDASQLQGRIVQFVKERSETGLRARRITVLDVAQG
jgi:cold shock CspA family protein